MAFGPIAEGTLKTVFRLFVALVLFGVPTVSAHGGSGHGDRHDDDRASGRHGGDEERDRRHERERENDVDLARDENRGSNRDAEPRHDNQGKTAETATPEADSERNAALLAAPGDDVATATAPSDVQRLVRADRVEDRRDLMDPVERSVGRRSAIWFLSSRADFKREAQRLGFVVRKAPAAAGSRRSLYRVAVANAAHRNVLARRLKRIDRHGVVYFQPPRRFAANDGARGVRQR